MCTGITAFVRPVTAAANASGSRLSDPASMSANTGVAPAWTIALTVAGQVNELVTTSSPGADAGGDQREVQRLGAGRRGDRVGRRRRSAANRSSSSRTRGPDVSQPERSVSVTACTSSLADHAGRELEQASSGRVLRRRSQAVWRPCSCHLEADRFRCRSSLREGFLPCRRRADHVAGPVGRDAQRPVDMPGRMIERGLRRPRHPRPARPPARAGTRSRRRGPAEGASIAAPRPGSRAPRARRRRPGRRRWRSARAPSRGRRPAAPRPPSPAARPATARSACRSAPSGCPAPPPRRPPSAPPRRRPGRTGRRGAGRRRGRRRSGRGRSPRRRGAGRPPRSR